MIFLSQRTYFLYRSFLGGLLSRGCVVFIQFVSIGIISRFLNEAYLGIWMLLSQFMILVTLFDFGLGGGGLRNELSKLDVNHDTKQRPLFLATFFFMLYFSLILSMILCTLWKLFFFKEVVFAVFFILLRLPFSLYVTGFLAYQKMHLKAACEVFEALFFLFNIYILTLLNVKNETFLFVIFFSLFLGSVFSLVFFFKTQKWSFQWVSLKQQKELIRSIIQLNFHFWLLNIGSLGLFSFCPFLIYKLLGLEKAGEFCLFQRMVSLVLGVHFLGVNALWSGFTDAYYRKDFLWIKKSFRKGLIVTLLYFGFFGVFLIFFHEVIIFIWTSKQIQNNYLAILFSVSALLYGIVNIFSVLLNSQNIIKKQALFLGLGSFIHMFLGFFLGKFYEEKGVLIAFIVSLIPILISDIIEVKTLPFWSYGKRNCTHS